MRQAEEYLRSGNNRHVMIAELCQALDVSGRKLHYMFKAKRGMPPDSTLKAQRLDRARDRMRGMSSENGLVRISRIENAFFHLGRFSATYRQRVGELPSETLKNGGAHAAAQHALDAQE